MLLSNSESRQNETITCFTNILQISYTMNEDFILYMTLFVTAILVPTVTTNLNMIFVGDGNATA